MSVAGDKRGRRTLSKLEANSSPTRTRKCFWVPPYLSYHSISTHCSVFDMLQSSSLINKMINELAPYQIQSNECLWSHMKDKEVLENIIEFWLERNSLPAWRDFAHLYYLLQPTSASVEHAFSMLKYIYTDQQSLSMVDLIKTTLMLRYNKD